MRWEYVQWPGERPRSGCTQRAVATNGTVYEVHRRFYESMHRTRQAFDLYENGQKIPQEFHEISTARAHAAQLAAEPQEPSRYDRRYRVLWSSGEVEVVDYGGLCRILAGGRDPAKQDLYEKQAALRELHQLEVHRKRQMQTTAGERIEVQEIAG